MYQTKKKDDLKEEFLWVRLVRINKNILLLTHF